MSKGREWLSVSAAAKEFRMPAIAIYTAIRTAKVMSRRFENSSIEVSRNDLARYVADCTHGAGEMYNPSDDEKALIELTLEVMNTLNTEGVPATTKEIFSRLDGLAVSRTNLYYLLQRHLNVYWSFGARSGRSRTYQPINRETDVSTALKIDDSGQSDDSHLNGHSNGATPKQLAFADEYAAHKAQSQAQVECKSATLENSLESDNYEAGSRSIGLEDERIDATHDEKKDKSERVASIEFRTDKPVPTREKVRSFDAEIKRVTMSEKAKEQPLGSYVNFATKRDAQLYAKILWHIGFKGIVDYDKDGFNVFKVEGKKETKQTSESSE